MGCLESGHREGRAMSLLRWKADNTLERKEGLKLLWPCEGLEGAPNKRAANSDTSDRCDSH